MKRSPWALVCLAMLFVSIGQRSFAAAELIPPRYALAVGAGKTYSPTNDIDFALLSAVALFDYDRVWPHRAPEPLRFKVEGTAGMTTAPRSRAVISANMLALYFCDRLASERFRPYAEAGIGLSYTDFQVDGQGLRVNFNPQAGIGTEITAGDGPPWYTAIRLYHLSNGGLHHENRGMNAVVLQVGRFF